MNLHKIKAEIIAFTKENRVITTSELASHFKISWNTAEKYLLELALDGKMVRIRKKGVNLWLLK